jgi:hypothetical protein
MTGFHFLKQRPPDYGKAKASFRKAWEAGIESGHLLLYRQLKRVLVKIKMDRENKRGFEWIIFLQCDFPSSSEKMIKKRKIWMEDIAQYGENIGWAVRYEWKFLQCVQ